MTDPLLHLSAVSKNYQGLRPLRIEQLSVGPGESVAIAGLDAAAAEVLANLLTGATLPDHGRIVAFGRDTTAIADSTEWLAFVDRFGIVSPRAVLLDGLSVIQNLAIPFTLEIEPPPPAVAERATALARDAGLAARSWQQRIADLDEADRMRVRLGRALALAPAILLVEHPTSGVARDAVEPLADDVRAAAARRGAALIVLSNDKSFVRRAAARVLALDPSTGRLISSG